MTGFCNLPEGFDADAAFHISPNPESICAGLCQFLSKTDDELCKMGENGYHLVTKYFTWRHVAEQTKELYEWLLGQRDKPDFVYED
jgi:poly(glycerol-phosphate) alpha-glucosyltransferase